MSQEALCIEIVNSVTGCPPYIFVKLLHFLRTLNINLSNRERTTSERMSELQKMVKRSIIFNFVEIILRYFLMHSGLHWSPALAVINRLSFFARSTVLNLTQKLKLLYQTSKLI